MNTAKQAMDLLNEEILLAESIGASYTDLAGDNPPPWLFVVCRHLDAIRDAAEALECLLNRGDGGCNPHGDTQAGAPCPCSRAIHPTTTEQAACSEKPSSLAFEGKNFQ